jgi:hypothetical protein
MYRNGKEASRKDTIKEEEQKRGKEITSIGIMIMG